MKNTIHEEILKTIQFLLDKKVKEAKFDCTHRCVVIQHMGGYTYQVKLNGQERIVKNGIETPLNVNQVVYLTLPQNNINDAYISGIVRG